MPFLTNLPLIKTGTYVYFDGSEFPKHVANKLFKIGFTQQITRYIHKFIAQGKHIDIDLSGEGLYPESTKTLYELRCGIKGNVLLYPRYPTTTYYNILEKSGFVPPEDLSTDDDKRYIGCYTEIDTPLSDPRLVEYVVKDFDTIYYRVYNDSFEDEKVILRFIVNRCLLIEPNIDEEENVKRNWDEYIAKGLLRVIVHPKKVRWEVK